MLNKDLDPGSGAYRDDGNETLGPRSRNAFEIVRTLWSIKKVFLTEKSALPTTA